MALFIFFTKKNPPSSVCPPTTKEPTLPNELIMQILDYLSLKHLLKSRAISKTWNLLAAHRAKQLISKQWLSKVRTAIPLPPFYLPTANTQFNLGLVGDFFGLSKETAICLRFETLPPLQRHLLMPRCYKSVLGNGPSVQPWRMTECFWAGDSGGGQIAESLGFMDMVLEEFEFAFNLEEQVERRSRARYSVMERGRTSKGGQKFICDFEGYKVTLEIAPIPH